MLHSLADRLTAQVRAGNVDGAARTAAAYPLSPIHLGVLATWMTQAGLSDTQILGVLC